mmetsp:Transcript_36930/g.48553  ORF Transcript_36930/g.48553 Transcript_36930/m.48553 type:complete len:339 (-) Transcript_36930:765-1781(-)
MEVLWLRKHLYHRLKHDELLGVHGVELGVEFKDFLLAAVELDSIVEDARAARDLAALRLRRFEELAHQVLIALSCRILRWVDLPGSIRQGVLSQELDDLFYIGATEVLSRTELVGDVEIVRTVVAGQLAEDTVSQVHIDHLVVLTGGEKRITRVVGRRADTSSVALARLLGSLARVLHLANLVPLVLCVTPHEGKGDAILAEDLDEAVRLAAHLALNIVRKVGELSNVDLFATLSRSLALFLIFVEVRALLILTGQVASELANLFVLCSNNDVAPGVVSHRPDGLRQLDGLLALAVSPELDRAVIATRDDLASVEAVNGEDEASVALIIHHMRAIHRP